MDIKHDLTQLIGSTPLVELTRYNALHQLPARLVVKLESRNPLGSVKDRAAYAMILDAEARGALGPGGVVIEPTSGNTGIGLAFVCAIRGYRLVLTMPENMSLERRQLLAALGAELVLTPAAAGMQGAVEEADRLAARTPGAFLTRQIDNPANPAAHETSTAQEILRDTDGQVAVFVACFGTGGTVSGVGRALKRHNPAIQVAAVEPAESPLVTAGHAGPHGIQGIGANFLPGNLDRSAVDLFLAVSTQDARDTCRQIARTDGILAGYSAGAAICAAARLAQRPENAGKLIVALAPDSGERYLSSGLYGE